MALTPSQSPACAGIDQLSLWTAGPPPTYGGGSPMDAAWWAYHQANPQVYRLLRRFALEAQRAGQRIGIRAIWERMRWHVTIETHDPSGADWKLNDHYTSRYARYLMETEPALAGFFEVRDLRS